MKKLWILAVTALCSATLSGLARADVQGDDSGADRPGPWLIRGRLSYFSPLNHSAPFGTFQGYAVHVETKIWLEADVSYFFAKNLAVELAVNAPTQQNVGVIGFGNLGTVNLLVPTLTVQYHFTMPKSPISPYVGLGASLTHVQSQQLFASGSSVTLTPDTVGYVYQIGCDIPISNGLYLNLDYKHLQSIPNLKGSDGTILTDANMSPNLFAIGIGYRF